MRLAVMFLALCLTAGCAQTAVVKCWEPAEIDATGINRIAIMEFTGEQGSAIASSLSTRLWENEFYTLVDRSELAADIRTASFSEQNAMHRLLAAAAAAKVDGVIFGSVVEYRCDDQILGSTEVDLISELASTESKDHVENRLAIDSKQVLLREGTVTIAFRLVDVQTGEVRASKQISQHYRGQMTVGESTLPERGRVLEMLMADCLNEIVQMLAPHEMTYEMKLAKCEFWKKGSGQVKSGLNLAAKGDWPAAKKCWAQAIAENPENHVAMFNLSIAATREQDYDRAEQHVLDALKHEHKQCYTAGLEKIRARRSALTRTNDQRESRVVSHGDSIWQ